jgi:hypothetical protein
MHLIRDFKKLAGYSPSQLLIALGDMRPEAVARAVKVRLKTSRLFGRLDSRMLGPAARNTREDRPIKAK